MYAAGLPCGCIFCLSGEFPCAVVRGITGNACGGGLGFSGVPAVRRADRAAYGLQRELRLFQIPGENMQQRQKNVSHHIYHGNPDLCG